MSYYEEPKMNPQNDEPPHDVSRKSQLTGSVNLELELFRARQIERVWDDCIGKCLNTINRTLMRV